MVQALAPIAASAKTGEYNKVFLLGNIRSLQSDPEWKQGFYGDRPPITGLRNMATVYAGWGLSEAFYRQRVFEAFGASNVEQFVELFWEALFVRLDANDLLAQMWTWWHNDLGDHERFAGDTVAALRSITAQAVLIRPAPISTFRLETHDERPSRSRTRTCKRSQRSGAISRCSILKTRHSSMRN
jgi:homoserine O-acetyltransferase